MAGGVSVIQDNTGQAVDGIDSAIGVALEKIGLLAENYAAKKCPVDTGNLRGSITYEVDAGDNAVYIGTNVEYAPYVELCLGLLQSVRSILEPIALVLQRVDGLGMCVDDLVDLLIFDPH